MIFRFKFSAVAGSAGPCTPVQQFGSTKRIYIDTVHVFFFLIEHLTYTRSVYKPKDNKCFVKPVRAVAVAVYGLVLPVSDIIREKKND